MEVKMKANQVLVTTNLQIKWEKYSISNNMGIKVEINITTNLLSIRNNIINKLHQDNSSKFIIKPNTAVVMVTEIRMPMMSLK